MPELNTVIRGWAAYFYYGTRLMASESRMREICMCGSMSEGGKRLTAVVHSKCVHRGVRERLQVSAMVDSTERSTGTAATPLRQAGMQRWDMPTGELSPRDLDVLFDYALHCNCGIRDNPG